MIKYTRTFIAILVAIATALTFAGCPTTTNDNEERKAAEFRAANPIVDGPVSVGDIDFELDAGINLTNAQIEAITAALSGLSAEQVAAFVDYVDGVTFAQSDLGATVGQGEDATATIRIAADVNVEEIMAALTAAQELVDAERKRARAEREAEEELARQASVITDLSAEFAGYISNITFADVDAPGYELDVDSDPVTASVTLPNNFTAEESRAFIEDTVMESIESNRDTDTGPVINFVQERESMRGDIIRFYAEEGVDHDTIRGVGMGTATQFANNAEWVSTVITLLDVPEGTTVDNDGEPFVVERGLKVVIGEDSRAIIYRDGTASITWNLQLQVGAMYAQQAATAQAQVPAGGASATVTVTCFF